MQIIILILTLVLVWNIILSTDSASFVRLRCHRHYHWHGSTPQWQSRQFSVRSSHNDDEDGGGRAIPPGRVQNVTEWIRLASKSLETLTGKTILHLMDDGSDNDEDNSILTLQDIPINERYAILSHGNQTDPIYNYFNRAALLQFQVSMSSEEEQDLLYALPSRYSAPNVARLRQEREEEINAVAKQQNGGCGGGVQVIPTAIRQTLTAIKKEKEDGSSTTTTKVDSTQQQWFQLHNVTLWNVFNDEGTVRLGQMAIFDRTLVEPINRSNYR